MRKRLWGIAVVLLGLTALAAAVMVHGDEPTDSEPIPVRADPNWLQRAQTKLNATPVDLSAVDRIELHALNPSVIDFDSSDTTTVSMDEFLHNDFGAEHQNRLTQGRNYRAQAKQALFPTEPSSCPAHTIIASRTLVGIQAQQLLQLWQSQTGVTLTLRS